MPKVGALADSNTDTAVNANNDTLEAAFNNTLSRDGSSPNQMNADLDMNGNDILNVGSINLQNIVVDNQLPSGGAYAGNLLVKDTATDYDVSWTSLVAVGTEDYLGVPCAMFGTTNTSFSGIVFGEVSTGANEIWGGFLANGELYLGSSGAVRIMDNQNISGQLILTGYGNTFDRLMFGGATASFPCLKRATVSLEVKLSDNSAFTNIKGKLTTETDYTGGAPTPTGYLVLYDAAGTAYKVPAEAL